MADAITKDLTFVRGDDFVFWFRINTVDTVTKIRTAWDLTGSTGKGQIRTTADEAGTLTADMVYDTSQASQGIAKFTISAATMASIAVGTYYYDVQITQGGIKKTWYRGKVTITPQVTTG